MASTGSAVQRHLMLQKVVNGLNKTGSPLGPTRRLTYQTLTRSRVRGQTMTKPSSRLQTPPNALNSQSSGFTALMTKRTLIQ